MGTASNDSARRLLGTTIKGAIREGGLPMTIDLNTYLTDADIPLDKTLVMRHTPTEKSLLRRLPDWADSNPEMYNNYQCNQNLVQEKQLSLATHLASFIGMKTGEALFVGIYTVEDWKEIPVAEYTEMEIVKELYGYGSRPKNQHHVKWFDLRLMPQMAELKGRLVLTWAEKYAARSWSRWAQPVPASLPMAGHALGSGRARGRWIARRVAHGASSQASTRPGSSCLRR
jgi:hypothetical protein